MIEIVIPDMELYDETKNEFITTKGQSLILEHSLVSVSKWESKWHKPFLTNNPKTIDESIDYIKCMTITQNVKPKIYSMINECNILEIKKYIDDDMTATTFNVSSKAKNNEIITSELIYYWMVSFNIPFECQKWHLNRLLTLLNVCKLKNEPPKKMSRSEIISRNSAINEARKKALNSKG